MRAQHSESSEAPHPPPTHTHSLSHTHTHTHLVCAFLRAQPPGVVGFHGRLHLGLYLPLLLGGGRRAAAQEVGGLPCVGGGLVCVELDWVGLGVVWGCVGLSQRLACARGIGLGWAGVV